MFLRFRSASSRDAFIEKAKREEPQMLPRIRLSKTQPDVVTIRAATPQERQRLREVIGSDAKIYEDVEFQTFSPG